MAYRVEDCLRACASLNERANVGKGNVCGAVRFHADLRFLASHGGNCWLKKGFGGLKFDKGSGGNNGVMFELQQ